MGRAGLWSEKLHHGTDQLLDVPTAGEPGVRVASEKVSQPETMKVSALAYPDSLLRSDFYFEVLLLTKSTDRTKINQTADPILGLVRDIHMIRTW